VKNGKTSINVQQNTPIAIIFAFCMLLLFPPGVYAQSKVFIARGGSVYFLSDAPLEMISATSNELTGALDLEERTFSFSIPVGSFEGFNSALQKTHFNEDYLETHVYPDATFKGKIIEEVNLREPGRHRIRAKGILSIHGVEYDRIIRCDVRVSRDRIKVDAKFTVFLDEHDIRIPSIVNQKIAEEIQVEISFDLLAQK